MSRLVEHGDHGEAGHSEPEPGPKSSANEINHCEVPCQYLERWTNDPFFARAMLGCFIRVSRGVDHEEKRVYDMAEIVGGRVI